MREESIELMIALGIYHKSKVYTKNLSGGMKRKLSVGIALIGKSQVGYQFVKLRRGLG